MKNHAEPTLPCPVCGAPCRADKVLRNVESTGLLFETLAEAMTKFAPDLAEELKKRWAVAIKAQDARLERFVAFLRATSPNPPRKADVNETFEQGEG